MGCRLLCPSYPDGWPATCKSQLTSSVTEGNDLPRFAQLMKTGFFYFQSGIPLFSPTLHADSYLFVAVVCWTCVSIVLPSSHQFPELVFCVRDGDCRQAACFAPRPWFLFVLMGSLQDGLIGSSRTVPLAAVAGFLGIQTFRGRPSCVTPSVLCTGTHVASED